LVFRKNSRLPAEQSEAIAHAVTARRT